MAKAKTTAKKTGKVRRAASQKEAESQNNKIAISVAVPQTATIRVRELSGLTDEERDEVIERFSKDNVGYVILNAPFKVRAIEPVA